MAELGGIWAQLNRQDEAAHWLDMARENAGFDCRYSLALAKAFAAAARYSESENAFEQVERCGQANGDVLVDMAGMEESRSNAGNAEADYRRAVQLEPLSTRTLSALATFYAGSKRHALASELWEKAAGCGYLTPCGYLLP
jgi:tetratricopeptide (TPR) repeat protein